MKFLAIVLIGAGVGWAFSEEKRLHVTFNGGLMGWAGVAMIVMGAVLAFAG